jgi:hypothetical protein
VIPVAKQLAAGPSGKRIGVTGRVSMAKRVAEPNLVGIASVFENAAGSVSLPALPARAIRSLKTRASQENSFVTGQAATSGS